eukprot:Sdes_comp10937_c0_seq1m2583
MEPNEFDKELKKYPIIRSRDYQTHSTASIYQDCNPSQPDNLLAHQSTSFRIGAHRSPTVEPRQACDESTNANVQKESSEKVHLRVKIMKAATLGLPSEVKISVFLLKTTVLDLKQLLSKETNLDSKHMKLLFKGKSLHDENLLEAFHFVHNDLLTLLVSKANDDAFEEKNKQSSMDLWEKLNQTLRSRCKFKSDADIIHFIHHVRQMYKAFLDSLSLDDIERIAIKYLSESSLKSQL